jgi:ABC-type multidrug transport system permease subunit
VPTCSTLWFEVPRIFLFASCSYAAVAFSLSRGAQYLRYEKLATSYMIAREMSIKPARAIPQAFV